TGRPARGDDRGVVRAAERSDPPQRHDPPGEQVTGRFSAPTVPPPSANPCPEPLSRSGSGVGAGPAPGLCPPPGAGVEPTERRGSRKARSARGAVLPAVPAAGRPGAGRLRRPGLHCPLAWAEATAARFPGARLAALPYRGHGTWFPDGSDEPS